MSDEFEQRWLDGLPPDWIEKRADFLCDPYRITVDPLSLGDDLVAHYSIPQVQETGGPIIEPASDIDSTKLLISSPTLLVSKLNPRKRTICIAEPHDKHVTLASGEFVAIKSEAIDRKYAYYLWCSEKVTDRLSAIVQSATRSHQRVNPADILKLPWKWPPLETQRRIARFLDEKTARIDGLIEKKHALLDRLTEKRQALITRAVTKAVDLCPPNDIHLTRDRRVVEAAGCMSVASWDTWKLAHAYPRIGSGTTPTSNQESYYTDATDDAGVPWITTAELRETYIETTASRVTADALRDFSALRVYEAGSLFIAMYGATIGRLGITKVAATCNQACCVLEKSAQFDNRFLFYWLWHRRSDLVALSTGGGQPNLSQQDVREERALCPPLETQRRIAGFLDEATAQLQSQSECIERSIELLNEYRVALITAAVTGKLDLEAT